VPVFSSTPEFGVGAAKVPVPRSSTVNYLDDLRLLIPNLSSEKDLASSLPPEIVRYMAVLHEIIAAGNGRGWVECAECAVMPWHDCVHG